MAQLDKRRTELMASSAIVLQRHARGFIARRRYLRTRRAVIMLQVPLPASRHPSPPCRLEVMSPMP